MDKSIVRVRFGPGSVIYIVVAALIAFAALYTQANLLFWVLGLVAGAFVVSFVASLFLMRGLHVHRLTPTRGAANEPLILRYHIVNNSRLPCFGLEIVETLPGKRRGRRDDDTVEGVVSPGLAGQPHGWVLHIGPGQSIQAEATCWPRRRGLLRFEKVVLRSGFPFGVIRKSVEFAQINEVLIHPPQTRLNRQAVLSLSSQDIGRGRHSDRGGGHDEFFGLRPYRPGDSYKLIDWKHSARGNNLVSREMAKARPPRMMILLDLTRPDSTDGSKSNPAWTGAQEEAINLSAALIREAYLHSIHVGLAVEGVACPWLAIHNSQAHRQRLLDSLAKLDLSITDHRPQLVPVRPTAVVKVVTPAPGTPDEAPQAKILNRGRYSRGQRSMTESKETRYGTGPRPAAVNT